MTSIRESTISSLDTSHLTRHLGRPTRQAVKHTRREIGIIYAAAKTTHTDFLLGSRYGYAIAILTSKQFINAYNRVCGVGDELEDEWEFEIPVRPTTTDPSIDDDTSDADRRRKVAEWSEQIAQWERFDAYEHVFKMKLEAAYDSQYFEVLRDDLLGYTHVCVTEMLDHLLEQCLALTDVEKQERLLTTQQPWNQDVALPTYYHNLDKLQEELDDDDIEWTDRQKMIQAIKEMYACHIFDARDMKEWEKKATADKTWVHLQSFFIGLYDDNLRYTTATGSKHGFESAANVVEEKRKEEYVQMNEGEDELLVQQLGDIALAATADKEHIQQMSNATDDLLAIVKDQSAQIKELVRQNGLLVGALASGNTQVAPIQDRPAGAAAAAAAAASTSNRNVTQGLSTAQALANRNKIDGGDTALMNRRGRCVVCSKHWKTATCFELLANKNNRPAGWTSAFL